MVLPTGIPSFGPQLHTVPQLHLSDEVPIAAGDPSSNIVKLLRSRRVWIYNVPPVPDDTVVRGLTLGLDIALDRVPRSVLVCGEDGAVRYGGIA